MIEPCFLALPLVLFHVGKVAPAGGRTSGLAVSVQSGVLVGVALEALRMGLRLELVVAVPG